jgi:uncharacterized Rmd1/YagE family protein
MFYFPMGEVFDRFLKWLKKPMKLQEHIAWWLVMLVLLSIVIILISRR